MSAPPSDIVCPLTKQVFVDPVIVSDGHTYERAAITNLVARDQLSPLDGSVLEERFYPNVMLRQKSAKWIAQQSAEREADALADGIALTKVTFPCVQACTPPPKITCLFAKDVS